MSASSLASSPQGLIGDSNLTCMKPNFWLLFLNLFPSCPHLSVIQLYSISYLCQKPSSHSWLLFSLIPHLGPSHNPMPLDYCLLASTLVPLWSVLHSIQNTIHTIDRIIFWNHKSDYFISLLNTSVVSNWPWYNLKSSSPFSNPSIIWPTTTSSIWSSTLPFYLAPHPTLAMYAIFQTIQVHLCYRTFTCSCSLCLKCSFFPEPQGSLPQGTFHQRGHGDHYLTNLYYLLPHLTLYYLSSGHFSQLSSLFVCFWFGLYISLVAPRLGKNGGLGFWLL